MVKELLVLLRVFSLPTRNWNMVLPCCGSVLDRFSAYLRGIETIIWAFSCILATLFSAYLRGIETSKNIPILKKDLRVFSLPTRNWNQILYNLIMYFHSRFQPTYEELKHFHVSISFLNLSCFQPTYEELKQFTKERNAFIRHVFSLPTRNWNPDIALFP